MRLARISVVARPAAKRRRAVVLGFSTARAGGLFHNAAMGARNTDGSTKTGRICQNHPSQMYALERSVSGTQKPMSTVASRLRYPPALDDDISARPASNMPA